MRWCAAVRKPKLAEVSRSIPRSQGKSAGFGGPQFAGLAMAALHQVKDLIAYSDDRRAPYHILRLSQQVFLD